MAASVMSGFGESYLGAFAIFLKASNAQIGLLAALPQLVGAWFQFFSVWLLHRIRSRRTIILTGVVGQAFSWVCILAIPFVVRDGAVWWLIAAVVVNFMLGQFALPAWNSLMGDLVDSNRRGRYFGRRNRAMSVAAFASLCAAGVILHRWEQSGLVAWGFALIFFVAAIARLLSAVYLSRMAELPYAPRDEDRFSLWQFLRDGRRTNFGYFVAYVSLTHFAVQVSGPFIAPYLLRDLGFTYLQFMFSTAVAVVAQFLTLPGWGHCCDRFGNKQVLTVTGLLLPIIPLLWLATTNFYWILALQMFAGLAWAGFALAMGNFLFDTVSPPKRPQCVAVFHSSIAAGTFLGALLGAYLISRLPNVISLGGLHLSLASDIQLLFLLSAILRLVVSLKFLPKISETREVSPVMIANLQLNLLFVGPIVLRQAKGAFGRISKVVAVWIWVIIGQRRA